MSASWVRQGTTTATAGTITLNGTPDSGFIGFSDAFTSGDWVAYVIEDGTSREIGIGTLTSGTDWTLSRDVIYETLVSGTYATYPSASAITLSGSAIVGVQATAMSTVSPVRNYSIGGTGNNITWGDTQGYANGYAALSFPTADRLYYEPVSFFYPRIIGKLSLIVTTANSGAQVKAGIYDATYDGLPGNRLAQVTFDCSTTGTKVVSLGGNLLLPAGVYFVGIASDDATTVQARGWSYASYKGGSELGRSGYASVWSCYSAYEDLGASWTDLPTVSGATSANIGNFVRPIAAMG